MKRRRYFLCVLLLGGIGLAEIVVRTEAQEFYFISSRDSTPGTLNFDVWNFDDGAQTRLTATDTIEQHPILSSADNLIYFSGYSPFPSSDNVLEIFSMTQDGANLIQITTDGGSPPFTGNSHPFLAPDEDSLFVTTHRDDHTSVIRRVSLSGDPMGVVVDHDAEVGHSPTATTPDGDKLYYASNETGVFNLYRSDLDGSNEEQITNSILYESGAAPRPDGSRVAFSRQDSMDPCRTHIMIADHNGGNVSQVTAGGDPGFKWPFGWDGSKILYVSNETGDQRIYAIEPNGTGKVVVVNSIEDDMHLLPDNTCGFPGNDIEIAGEPLSGPPGTIINFEVDTGGETFAGFDWNFGDGKTDTTMKPTVAHSYMSKGVFAVSVVARDNCTPPSKKIDDLPTVIISTLVFRDGFESGDTSAWSNTVSRINSI